MITINLSEEQAKKLLHAVGWRTLCGSTDAMMIEHGVAKEIFTQLEQKFSPRPTDAAETAKWLAENGYTALNVHNWKRKHKKSSDHVSGVVGRCIMVDVEKLK